MEFMNMNLNAEKFEPKAGPSFAEAHRLVSAEIEHLRQTRRAIDAQLKKAEAAKVLLQELLHTSAGPLEGGKASREQKRFHRGSKTFEVVTRCKEFLHNAGRPLDRRDLLSLMQRSGFVLDVANPARFIGRTLWENPDFIHIQNQGYWLAGDEIHK